MSINELSVCPLSNAVGLERTRFFPRQLVTPDDLTQDQIYFRDKLRRHNRLLHGWGVVCGCEVEQVQDAKGNLKPWTVVIKPGYVLGPCGNEMVVDQEVTRDLRHEDLDGYTVGPCRNQLDPWCSEVEVDRPVGKPLYIAIRYVECEVRPVRIHPAGCGCDETECEYSRIHDSYAIKVFTDEPDEPWVTLAKVERPDSTMEFNSKFERQEIGEVATSVSGWPSLVDRQVGLVATPPGAAVSLLRPDGSRVSMSAYFTVQPGETFADLLAREGDREFYDRANDETYTLRELYALAEVDPQTTIEGAAEALAPLEGQLLDVGNMRAARAELKELLDARGVQRLERDHVGAPRASSKLPATDLKGVSPSSALGRKLADTTVADVAGMPREAFIARALKDVSARRRKAVERQASEVWTRATEVVNLSAAWRDA